MIADMGCSVAASNDGLGDLGIDLGIEIGGWVAKEVPGKGYRGAVAEKDIPPGSLLCRVPSGAAWVDDESPVSHMGSLGGIDSANHSPTT